MSIAVQCGACTARYKVVDTAAGRRVRCRRCGKPVMVPGGAADESPLDLRAMADLERKGQIIETPEDAVEQYKTAMAAVAEAPAGPKKDRGRSYAELAVNADVRKLAMAKDARKSINAAAVSEGMPFPLAGLIGLGVVAVVMVVLALFSPSMALVSLFVLGGSAVLFGIWAALEARAVLIEEDFIIRLMCRYVPFYRAWFFITRWREMLKSMVLHFISRVLGVMAIIACVFALPRMHELGWLNSRDADNTTPVVASAQPQELDSLGEVRRNTPRPAGLPEGVPYIDHRPQTRPIGEPNRVTVTAGAEAAVNPPPDFDKDLLKLVTDRAKTAGFVPKTYNVKWYLMAHVANAETVPKKFKESNGTYTRDDSGTVSAKVPRVLVQLSMTMGEATLFQKEIRLLDITGPITPEPGQSLDDAVRAKQWKEVLETYKTMEFPTTSLWFE